MSWSTYIGVLILAIIGFIAWSWLDLSEEYTVIDIMASREPELALPVFAQFVVTQTLTIEDPADLERIVVPLYFPTRDVVLAIRLLDADGWVLWRWHIQSEQEGIVDVALPLLSAGPVSGELHLEFSARSISHDRQDSAPRLFVETADELYRGGNYRIADNEKQGDVSLVVVAKQARRDRLWGDVQRYPLRSASRAGISLAVVALLVSLPSVFLRTFGAGGAK